MTVTPEMVERFDEAVDWTALATYVRREGGKILAELEAVPTLPFCPQCGEMTLDHPDEWMRGFLFCATCQESVGYVEPEAVRV